MSAADRRSPPIVLPPSAVAVVGDPILDRYVFGGVSRISPEAPVQVMDVSEERYDLGGAANVAEKLSSLGMNAVLCGAIGADMEGRILVRLARKAGIEPWGLVADPSRPTTFKTRFIARGQQMLRVDRESRAPLSGCVAAELLRRAKKAIGGAKALVIEDYAKGTLTDRVLAGIIRFAARRRIPIVVDPKRKDFSVYRGCTILTPNRKETEEASGIRVSDPDSLLAAGDRLLKVSGARWLVVTLDRDGLAVVARENGRPVATRIPARARAVFDPTGAGDAVTATLAACLAAGMPIIEAARMANLAAGLVVEQVGVGRLSWDAVRRAAMSELFPSAWKILDRRDIVPLVKRLRREGKKIVFTNGCFDLLHSGHVALLEKARSFGDVLMLAINSDRSVARLKGPDRPVVPQEDRVRMLASLSCVDYVTVFEEPTPKRLLRLIKPDVLVKGGDNTPTTAVGWEIVTSYGGRVEIVPLVEGISTTRLVEKIRGGRR
ncbi:MAG: D-glycero-beta-D-manno-heptose 1-phosphate adenylyltransferase [Planctomycetota bacterium]|nr:D-glycero-beta-D-manno-heptose 1-phosphate adenylyltransferase [Planctomycetota bacterium]